MDFVEKYERCDIQINKDPDAVMDALSMVVRSKGLNQRDLSELNGWPVSKTNKILKGRQKIQPADCRVTARSLGCVLRGNPLGNDGRGNVEFLYNVGRFGNFIMQIRNDPKSRDEQMISSFEMPISIVNLLGINATNYIITAETKQIDKSTDGGIFILFEQRHVDTGKDAIRFGLTISPDRNTVILGIWYFPQELDEDAVEIRHSYKHILDVSPSETKEYDEFAEKNEKWLTQEYRYGEIDSVIYTMEEITNADFLEREMIALFTEYCRFINDALGFDISENFPGAYEGLSASDMYNGLMGRLCIPYETRQDVLESNGRRCELDDGTHKTFVGMDGMEYMEIVPLIPLITETMSKYGRALYSEANAVCLCPMCVSKLKHACHDDREDMLSQLYRKHREKLRKINVNVSLSELLTWHMEDIENQIQGGNLYG